MSWRRFLALRIRDRIARRFSISCFEESPCFVRACSIRRIPASVFGPVLRPPWSLHRSFVMAGQWHSEPRRVFALHLGAFVKSPQGLPFLSQPRPGSWGLSSLFGIGPLHRRNCPHHCSPAGIHIYVLNYDLLYCQLLTHQHLPISDSTFRAIRDYANMFQFIALVKSC
jgi:hypothetical protein